MLSVLDYKIIARPNNSLSSEGAFKLLVLLGVLALMVAVGFTHIGAWLVLPFAGLELLAFALAFYHIRVHASDFESITIDGDEVLVEKKYSRQISSAVFQRYWTQVSVKESASGRNALMIGSHGKEVEFGKHFIDDEQRIALVRELKKKLRNIN
ncbi:MAG: DUF2244 domain-containing protein [Methylophilus sp.]|nr:DUF2244 domain-containing protein [Methylophilus sp.]MDP3609004.1 DUF2244 domain-containing protein [Methylophilus sp.]